MTLQPAFRLTCAKVQIRLQSRGFPGVYWEDQG